MATGTGGVGGVGSPGAPQPAARKRMKSEKRNWKLGRGRGLSFTVPFSGDVNAEILRAHRHPSQKARRTSRMNSGGQRRNACASLQDVAAQVRVLDAIGKLFVELGVVALPVSL